MKLVITLGLALLATIAGFGALAENRWQGGSYRWESGNPPGSSGVIRDNTPGTTEFKPQREMHERDRFREHEHDRNRDHDRNRHRPPAIIGVPIIVTPGYYSNPQPVYVTPAPQYYVEPIDGYWYYCPDLGYYPEVRDCPNGWLKVVPNNQ